MASKIINMADRIRDEVDERLVTLFRAEPIADNGFSERVTRRIRRRLWVRRLAIPLAATIGGAISLNPLASMVTLLIEFARSLPFDVVATTSGWIPSLPLIGLGVLLLVAMLLGLRLIDE